MIALLFLPIVWCAVACGSAINRLAGASPQDAQTYERRLFGLATGLVLLAYSILALGLIGLLSALPILACCIVQAAIGFKEHRAMLHEVLSIRFRGSTNPARLIALLFFLFFAFAALVGCFTPPTASEWDSLSYHLADPATYLAHHRIVYLPWESHSNFAFTMEMLYTLGLSLHSIPLAKLFHWSMGVAATAATYSIGRRVGGTTVGVLSALLFASLPLVFWEAGTAYVDLAATAFGALGLAALIAALVDEKADPAWLRISMIMLACMISVKATSLVPAGLYAAAVFGVGYGRSRNLAQSFVSAATYGLGAALLGSVWYIKAWVVAGNPFFPFAYSVFGGHHWNAANSAGYAQSQAVFGVGHRAFDLLLAPWNLVLYLLPNNVPPETAIKPFNDFQTYFASLSPVLLAALYVPAFWKLKSPAPIRLLGLFGLLSLIIWFVLTQQVRYLLPTMPVYCVLAGFVVARLWETTTITKYAMAALTVAGIVFSSILGILLLRQELPVALGIVSRDSYIARGLESYGAMVYMNRSTPEDSGVVCYGEPRDFYINRRYMWGEPGHGLVIPYDSMTAPAQLKTWMLSHGYQYVLLGTYASVGPGAGINGLIYGVTYGSGTPPVYQSGNVTLWRIQ